MAESFNFTVCKNSRGLPHLTRSEAKGVPILVVGDDTYKAARNVENMIGQLGLHES